MKKRNLLLTLASSLLLLGCSNAGTTSSTLNPTSSSNEDEVTINSDKNYDSDQTSAIVTDEGTSNDFDSSEIQEEIAANSSILTR